MAFDFFPKTTKELKQKLSQKKFPYENSVEIVTLFEHLQKKFPKVETPMNLDMTKKSNINITRMLDGDFPLKQYQKNMKKVKMRFGNGSSGNRGVNNRGNLFEPQFAEGLMDWWNGNESKVNPKVLESIQHLDKTYGIKKSRTFKVDVVGGENTRRPLQFQGKKIILDNPKGQGYEVGKSVTDITITLDGKKEIYLSLKLGGTTTFFNVGVKTILTRSEIENEHIENEKGLALLNMLGIDPMRFSRIFNGDSSASGTETVTMGKEMQELLKSGIGYNYHIIHKLSGKVLSKEMDKKAMEKASRVGKATIHYGGKTGTGKRVDITMSSPTYKFTMNIRDTQGGDGYPTRLMCNFNYVNP